MYDQLDSYRAMIDREGAGDPENISFFGDEAERRRKIQRLRDIGVSDLNFSHSRRWRARYEDSISHQCALGLARVEACFQLSKNWLAVLN